MEAIVRTIEVSTEVFAKIWSQRVAGEEDENAILTRLLGPSRAKGSKQSEESPKAALFRPLRWRDDVMATLHLLGGEAPLKHIYEGVRNIRRSNGRSVPANLEAIVRRELEYNSSDASVFQGKRDWFRSVGGIGSGVWALREQTAP